MKRQLKQSRTSLYISYDGLLEPLGRSQVLPYVRTLARGGVSFAILSFEKPADLARANEVDALHRELAAEGIAWVRLRYHKWPSAPATAWDVVVGTVVACWQALFRRVRVIHCRSYVSAVIGRSAGLVSGARLLFDMRGFWPEERVEGRLWAPSSRLFRAAKRVERRLLRASDAVVVLTERARAALAGPPYREALRADTPVFVIPCCVEIERFAAPNVHEARTIAPRVLVYAGSIGTWYMLDEMLDFFATVRADDSDMRFLVLARGEHERIRRGASHRGVDVDVIAAAPLEIPRLLAGAYAGIYFITPTFSKSGASPTKLGEYLAAGLPVVVNAGVGDADALVEREEVGVVVERFEPGEYAAKWAALSRLADRPGLRARCRETARRCLGLDLGVERYRQVYETLLAPSDRGAAASAKQSASRPPR